MTHRTRFVARRMDSTWCVYDRTLAWWPITLTGFGAVQQNMPTETAAQAEADRLATYYRAT